MAGHFFVLQEMQSAPLQLVPSELFAAFEIYGFYCVIYASLAPLAHATFGLRKTEEVAAAAWRFLRRKCAHRLRVKSRTHTKAHPSTRTVSAGVRGQGASFLWPSVFIAGQCKFARPLARSCFTYLISQLSSARLPCPCPCPCPCRGGLLPAGGEGEEVKHPPR